MRKAIEPMTCDIIIPIWNNLSYTKECVEHIAKNTKYPYRAILIDNASDVQTRRYLEGVKASAPDRIELIRNDENLGFVKAVNQGLAISKAPYICVFNNDTLPAPGWLERMVEFAESHKDVGLINPQCDGHLDRTIEDYAGMLADKNRGRYMEMNQCQGFCMLVKREVVEKIGYLDEAFGIGGFDDTDYSMRAHRAGYKSVCIYDSYVYHRQHASFNKAGNREEWVRRNQKIYYDKWGKHLRIGIAASLKEIDEEMMARMINFSYGLAREWTWVYLWVNFRGGKNMVQSAVEKTIVRGGLPPHQNIKIQYFNLPPIIFSLAVFGKLLGRLRARMRDKRFDAVVIFEPRSRSIFSKAAGFLKTNILNITFDGNTGDWEAEGKKAALSVKERRDSSCPTAK